MTIKLSIHLSGKPEINYKNKYSILLCLQLMFTLFGCQSMSGSPQSPLEFSSTNVKIESGEDLINKYSEEFSQEAIKPVEDKPERNKLISKALTIIDYRYSEFINGTEVERKTKDMITDFVELSMNLAGTAVGAAGTKTILAAISAGVNGINGSIDKNYFYEKTYPSLVAQMNADRKDTSIVIMKGMNAEIEEYTWPQAVNDLIAYYNAGTLFGAISSIQKQAGVKEQKANDEIKEIRTGTYSKDEAADLLVRFWKPDGKKVDKANESKILEWMKDNGLPADRGNMVNFMTFKEYSDLRLKAVADLKLQP